MPQQRCIKCQDGTQTLNLSTGEWTCNKCGYKHGAKKQEDQIEKAMDRKEGFISKSIDKKNTAIEIAGAKRDAVLIVTALLANEGYYKEIGSDVKLKKVLEDWARYWLHFDPSQEEEPKLQDNLFN